jgi:hypothetical protein
MQFSNADQSISFLEKPLKCENGIGAKSSMQSFLRASRALVSSQKKFAGYLCGESSFLSEVLAKLPALFRYLPSAVR